MIHFIYIYFIINAYLTGYIFDNDGETLPVRIFMFFLGTFFGIPILIILVLQEGPKWMDEYFQIKFFYQFYLGHKYKDVQTRNLEKMNSIAVKYRTSNSVSDRIFRKCVAMLNKRYNYTPK